jgi:ubiquinone/menaquinone biosynthesis C-methylase UbiE
MPDVWSTLNSLEASVQDRLAGVLETRGADAQQQALRRDFLDSVGFAPGSRVLEVGCGTGVLTRRLAGLAGIAEVVGVDVASSLLERGRELAAGLANVTYLEADARSLPFPEAEFDAVVFDSTLTHVPGPGEALAEAARVLRPGGRLAVFDGDYSTTTVALGDHDHLQTCVEAMMAASVHDLWLARRLPALVREHGFTVESFRSHGFVETGTAEYMLSVVDRGADILLADGRLGSETADALKAEARRRVDAGTFFGHIAYVSLVASAP